MKITDVRTVLLTGPCTSDPYLSEARKRRSAALDTHYYYPMPPDHPLWHDPQVIIIPHISGTSANQRFAGRIWAIFCENLRRLAACDPFLNELTAPELRGET